MTAEPRKPIACGPFLCRANLDDVPVAHKADIKARYSAPSRNPIHYNSGLIFRYLMKMRCAVKPPERPQFVLAGIGNLIVFLLLISDWQIQGNEQ